MSEIVALIEEQIYIMVPTDAQLLLLTHKFVVMTKAQMIVKTISNYT